MQEDLEQLDEELAALARSLRDGDHMLACVQLGDFARKLDRYIGREERALELANRLVEATSPKALVAMRREHTSLREIVAAIASALDQSDGARAIDIVGKLRSVLLLHVTKEQPFLPPPSLLPAC
jgi:hypothetical protein